ncbi:MAG: hypothetical protein ACLRFJ_03175, partial [Alphaproteobacteria bacterium]
MPPKVQKGTAEKKHQEIELSIMNEIPEADAPELSPEEIWWNALQQTLNNAKCGLNLNEPKDLARLFIFDVNRLGRDEYQA